jgi:hypothetical protein
MGKRGPKAFAFTDEQRRQVKMMAALGLSHDNIAKVIVDGGIKRDTLCRHFRKELDQGKIEANLKVAKTAFDMATSGTSPAMTCFWLKTQAGWRENPIDADGMDKPLPWED